jgi:alpha,alpha-trehalose phosphorylase
VIPHPYFPVEPWNVRELGLDLDVLAQSESIFALSNGHIGIRGNLDEGDPNGLPGSYLNSFHETYPHPSSEAGFGYPESGQSILNVTNGKLIRLLIGDEPFDLRHGTTRRHERLLDLRSGQLRRGVEWTSPSGQSVRVRSVRLVSFTQRSIVGIRYEVEAVDRPIHVAVQSGLVANEHLPPRTGDPRVATSLEDPLQAQEPRGEGTRAMLVHRTRSSGLRMVAAMDHVLEEPSRCDLELTVHEDWARLTVATSLEPGQRLVLTKFVAYGWSGERSAPALRDQADAALTGAVRTGWDQLAADQRAVLDEFWRGADIEIDGDERAQQAIRFALFQTFQATTRAEQRAIPAKGLTGPGYDGHAFWDTESFVLPLLTATVPRAAADALKWRHTTLDRARERAHTLRLRGAAFPWRTIDGQECSGYWPASTGAVHINADIALAAARYVAWTQDAEFDRDHALPLLVETARLWVTLGYHGADGRFHLDGVTGPDEYSAIADDNVYTNLMAAANLLAAADAAERWPDQAGVDASEIATWRAAAAAIAVPYDIARQVHQQDKGFTDHAVWDFQRTAREDSYPLLLHAPYFDLYRKQVVKQADLILAMHWRGDAFTPDDKAQAFSYYEPLTVRDSSLSACTQAVIAAEVGHLDLAADYLAECALMDLNDLEHNVGDGLHLAALAGTWIALVAGFGGLRDHDGRLSLHPQLPPGWRRYSFLVRWHAARLRVSVTADQVTYEIVDSLGADLTLQDCGEPITLRPGQPVQRRLQPIAPRTPPPSQPAGRAPQRSRPTVDDGSGRRDVAPTSTSWSSTR